MLTGKGDNYISNYIFKGHSHVNVDALQMVDNRENIES